MTIGENRLSFVDIISHDFFGLTPKVRMQCTALLIVMRS